MRLYLFSRWCYFIRKRRPVSYGYSFEDLLALLHGHAPAKVDAVARHRRRVEHGRLSVGLKIHCLGDGSQFSTLVEGLGGAQKILDVNYYKHSHASLCLVLPPVGNARSAILLLECIGHFVGPELFSPFAPAAVPFFNVRQSPKKKLDRSVDWRRFDLPQGKRLEPAVLMSLLGEPSADNLRSL